MRGSRLVAGALCAVLAACGGDDGDGPTAGAAAAGGGGAAATSSAGMNTAGMNTAGIAPVSFAQSVMPKVTEACNCHQSTPILMAPFSLKVGEAYGNLVGAASLQVPTMKRVAPGSLNTSYLWHKINGTHLEVGGSGLIMPSNIPLNPAEIDLFGRWIASGAQP